MWNSKPLFRRLGRGIVLVLSVPLLIGCFERLDAHVYSNGKPQRLLTLQQNPSSAQPAIDFLLKNNIQGLVLNSDRVGGYLQWAAWPQLKPLVDGRQARLDLFQLNNRICFHPEQAFGPAQKYFQFQTVLLDSSLPSAHKLMPFLMERPDWQLVFLRGNIVIFLKKDIFSLPQSAVELERHLKEIPWPHHSVLKLKKIAKTQGSEHILSRPFAPYAYNQVLEEGFSLLVLGLYPAALQRFAEAVRIDPGSVRPLLAQEILRLTVSR